MEVNEDSRLFADEGQEDEENSDDELDQEEGTENGGEQGSVTTEELNRANRRKSSTLKFLEEVRTSSEYIAEGASRGGKNRTTRNSRGEGMNIADLGANNNAILEIARIKTRTWKKELTQVGSMFIPLYIPSQPEKTPGLAYAAGRFSKKVGSKRSKRQVKPGTSTTTRSSYQAGGDQSMNYNNMAEIGEDSMQ